MCVMSMVMDHYYEKWVPFIPEPQPVNPFRFYPPLAPLPPSIPVISPAEVEEFRKLLERAREYDKRHDEPDCELDEKRQKIKQLAAELGVEINFV